MSIVECFIMAIDGIWANKMRSFLTMLGVIIGVAAVIAVLAVAQGGSAAVVGQIQGLGSNLIIVQPNYAESSGRPATFTLDDVNMLKEKSTAIKSTTVEESYRMLVAFGENNKNSDIMGVNENYSEVRSTKIAYGRFFTKFDVTAARRVVILGETLAKDVFKGSDPIGKTVRLDNSAFIVIGVLEKQKQGMFGGPSANGSALIPITTFGRQTGLEDINVIYVQAVKADSVAQAQNEITAALSAKYDPAKFRVVTMESILSSVTQVTGIMGAVIAGIAGISLLVGGIGIMNIMLVSVTERTREIGLRKAIGAKRRDILLQFLIEAVLLSAVGGAIGILLGYGLVSVISLAFKLPSLISWWSILIALGFSAGVGIFFGIYPANKAARLDPIEALRYE